MNPRFKYFFLTSSLFSVLSLVFGTYDSSAAGQQPALVTLQATGDVLEANEPISSISTSEDEQALYLVSALTGDAEAYSTASNGAARSLGRVSKAITKGAGGHAARIDKDLKMTVFDPSGRFLASFITRPAVSYSILSDGNVVVASPTGQHFLHVYSPTGQRVRSFGTVKDYDRANPSQNQFLHKGKVLVDAADNIYYVFHYLPLIQKFSPDGRLKYESRVEGEAIDLQQELASRFFSIKSPQQVGGIGIVNSATIDRATGNLWLAMSGSSLTGVVYEYNGQGEKLREYILQTSLPDGSKRNIIAVDDIAITASTLHVLTPQRQVYRFNRRGSSTARINYLKHVRLAPSFAFRSAGSPNPLLQSCGQTQTWEACPFVCPGPVCVNGQPTTTSSDGSTKECKAALAATLTSGYSVISANCTQFTVGTQQHMRGGCRSEVTICRDGNPSGHNITLDCPTPTCSGSGGGGLEDQNCSTDPHAPGCPPEPVVIDVLGNGFNLTNFAGGVNFDLNSDGAAEQLSWTSAGSDDAWLALDRNGNGAIDNGQELFGNFTPQPTPPQGEELNGFLALAEFDKPANGGNSDGLVSVADSIFLSLRLWRDTNHNGVSEAGELGTLPSLGVAKIDLGYRESRRVDEHGNMFRFRAKVYGANGTQLGRWAYDVFLRSGQ